MAVGQTCKICGAGFSPQNLTDGKCSVCLKAYPDANSREEAMAGKEPQHKMSDTLEVGEIKTLITSMLDERFAAMDEKLDKALAATTKRPVGRPPKEAK